MLFKQQKLLTNMLLIVEDDHMLRELLKDWFLEEHDVVTAQNGKEAIQLCEQFSDKLKLIITDYEMPLCDGLEFLRWLRAKNNTIPVLVMTGRALSDDEERNIRYLSKSKLLLKPFNLEQLSNALKEICAARS